MIINKRQDSLRVLFSIGRIFKSYCSFSLVLIIRLKRIRNVISAVMAAAQAIPMRAMAAKENSIGKKVICLISGGKVKRKEIPPKGRKVLRGKGSRISRRLKTEGREEENIS